MQPFQKAIWERDKQKDKLRIDDMVRKLGLSRSAAKRILNVGRSCDVYLNEKYQVAIQNVAASKHWPAMVHLSIKTLDRSTEHDWREFQDIKNWLVGYENDAVELYPAESRKVDAANQYHLWVLKDAKHRFPFGFTQRFVDDREIYGSKQRTLERTNNGTSHQSGELQEDGSAIRTGESDGLDAGTGEQAISG